MRLGSKTVISNGKKQLSTFCFRSILKQPISLSQSQYFNDFISSQNDSEYVKGFMQDVSVPYNEKLVILDYLFQAHPDLDQDWTDPDLPKPVLFSLFETQDLVLSLYSEFVSNLVHMDCSELLQFIVVVGDNLNADIYQLFLDQTRRIFVQAQQTLNESENPALAQDLNELLVNLMFSLHSKQFDPPLLRPNDLEFFWGVFRKALDTESKIDFLNSYLTFLQTSKFDDLALQIAEDIFQDQVSLDSTFFCNLSFAVLNNCISQIEAGFHLPGLTIQNKFHVIDKIKQTNLEDLPGGNFLLKLEQVSLCAGSQGDLIQLSQLFSNGLMMQITAKTPTLSQKMLQIFMQSCVPNFPDDYIFQTNYKVSFLASEADLAQLEPLLARTNVNISFLKRMEAFMLKNKLNMNLRIIKRFEFFLKRSQLQTDTPQSTQEDLRGMSEKDLVFQHYFQCLSALVFMTRVHLIRGESIDSIRQDPVVMDLENGFRLSVEYIKAISENPVDNELVGPDVKRAPKMSLDEFYSHAVDGFADALYFLCNEFPVLAPTVRDLQRIFDMFCESLDSDSDEF